MRFLMLLASVLFLSSSAQAEKAPRPIKIPAKGMRAGAPLSDKHLVALTKFMGRALPEASITPSSIRVFGQRKDGSRTINITTREVHGGASMDLINSISVAKDGTPTIDHTGRSSSILFKTSMHRLDTDPAYRQRFMENTARESQRRFEMGD